MDRMNTSNSTYPKDIFSQKQKSLLDYGIGNELVAIPMTDTWYIIQWLWYQLAGCI